MVFRFEKKKPEKFIYVFGKITNWKSLYKCSRIILQTEKLNLSFPGKQFTLKIFKVSVREKVAYRKVSIGTLILSEELATSLGKKEKK